MDRISRSRSVSSANAAKDIGHGPVKGKYPDTRLQNPLSDRGCICLCLVSMNARQYFAKCESTGANFVTSLQ